MLRITSAIPRPVWLSCVLLLAGCASISGPETSRVSVSELDNYLHDEVFPAPTGSFALEAAPDFLHLPAKYQQELDRSIATIDNEYQRYLRLRRWAFRKFNAFEFNSLETSSLAELNNNRQINCLSFSVFFVAAARYVDVPADFQLVFAPPYWDSQNGSWIINQHINVIGDLGFSAQQPSSDLSPSSVRFAQNDSLSVTSRWRDGYRYVVDVNPAVNAMRSRGRVIEEHEVLSLYYSNKSVEALMKGEMGIAYQYTSAALAADPDSSLAWNNLGVLYKRAGQVDYAATAYQLAVAVDDSMQSAKSNLARLYRERGELDAALLIEEEVEKFRNDNPYYLFAQAETHLSNGDLELARNAMESAIDKKHNEHYFYHQLAMIYQQLGETEAMLKNLESARRYSSGSERARFSNKLAQLEELYSSR